MKNQKGSISTVLIILLALALVGAIGYIVWQKSAEKVSDTSTKTKTTTAEAEQPAEKPKPTNTYTLGNFTFEAPKTWTGFTQMPDSNNVYAVDMSSSIDSATTKFNRGTIEVQTAQGIDADFGGTYFYQYNAGTKTWEQVDRQAIANMKGIFVNFMGGGVDQSYSLTANYMRVIGEKVVIVTVQETGDPTSQYSFAGSAPYKSNALQEDVVAVLNSVK